MTTERCGITGSLVIEHRRRSSDGEMVLIDRRVVKNLITQYGDQFYGERAVGIGAHDNVSGMKLGTGVTAPAKTGAGAALVTYKTASHQGLAVGFPAALLEGGKRRIEFQSFWDEGVATDVALAEVVLVNEAILADATSPAGETLSRHVFSPVIDKQAADTLTITWAHDLLGA